MTLTLTNRGSILRIRNAGLNPPEALTLQVTNGCNLHCRHCILKCRFHDKVDPVPTEILLKRIVEFAALGGERISIAGGEPLCHPDYLEIITFCCGKAEFREVCIQTNATLLTPDHVDALLELPTDKLLIQVSLDGASPHTNDHVRGPGTYELAVKGIQLLVKAGLGGQTRIAFTEMVHNFEDLPALLEMVDGLGIGRLVSGTLLYGGRAVRSDRISQPVPSQYRELITRYHEDNRLKKIYHRRGNIAAIEWHNGMAAPVANACSCIKDLFIDANDWMYPCVMMPADKYAVKMAEDKSLGQLVIESLPLWGELPKIGKRRQTELKFCKGCPGKNHCHGGCMGRAYTAHGNLMGVEDRCALRKAVYSWQLPS